MLKPAFTIRNASAKGGAMEQRSPQAAGCLLFLAILVGLVIGLNQGLTGPGLIYGAVAGIVLAVGYWLIDRRRSGR